MTSKTFEPTVSTSSIALPESLTAELARFPPFTEGAKWQRESLRLYRLIASEIAKQTGRMPTDDELERALPTGSIMARYRVLKDLTTAVRREQKRRERFLRWLIFGG